MTDFLARLKQRKLVQWALAYVAFAFAAVQGIDVVGQQFGWPDALRRGITIALAIGFFVTLVIAWYHGERGAQKVTGMELLILALLLAIGGGLLWRMAKTPQRVTTAFAVATSTEKTAPIPDKSIAVLPLTNESSDKDQRYFSDGLSESLIVALSQFSALKVIGRNSSFRFRDSQDDSRTIGEKLGVATLLEGSVQRAGDAVRISAELIHAADGVTVWSQNYDRPYKDLFKLQDEITQSVAGALKARLLTNDGAAVQTDRPPGGNLDAYNAYLQGNYYAARGSEDDLRKAIAEYETATRIDPRYALAWAAMAHAGDWLASAFLSGVQGQPIYAQVRKAADTALRLDPNLAAAHNVRGEQLGIIDFDWKGSEAEQRRALELEPGNNQTMENLGVGRAQAGRSEEAIAMTRQSLVTDPMRASGYLLLARYLTAADRLDEAERAIRRAIELQPAAAHFDAGLVDIEVRRDDAKAALDAAQKVPPGNWQDYALAMASQIGNDRAAADAALQRLIAKDADGMYFQIAEVQAVRGDANQTFAWLDRALANRDSGLQFLLVNPFILRFKDDPRFAAFCKRLGVPATTDAKAMP